MNNDTACDTPQKKKFLDLWWGKLLLAVVIWGIAGYLYFALTQWEQTGGAMRLNALVVLAYKLGGVKGAVGFTAALGAVLFVLGIRQRSAEGAPTANSDILADAERKLRRAGV